MLASRSVTSLLKEIGPRSMDLFTLFASSMGHAGESEKWCMCGGPEKCAAHWIRQC